MPAKPDREIVSLILKDFQKFFPDVHVSDHVTGTQLTKFAGGKVSLTPEFFKLLPDLQKPVGNIHFLRGLHGQKFFSHGAVMSGFRVARALGSQYLVSESDEIRFARTLNWGVYGSGPVLVRILIILIGFY
ncbi:MAG: FAD-dependent oxidoreductase [Proteobacteria bacterium]|nr:FAD-dependent oxidoreductase [Pseudomonadota bacterium]